MTAKTAPAGSKGGQGLMRSKNSKPEEIRRSNIMAAKALSDAINIAASIVILDQTTHAILLLLLFQEAIQRVKQAAACTIDSQRLLLLLVAAQPCHCLGAARLC